MKLNRFPDDGVAHAEDEMGKHSPDCGCFEVLAPQPIEWVKVPAVVVANETAAWLLTRYNGVQAVIDFDKLGVQHLCKWNVDGSFHGICCPASMDV